MILLGSEHVLETGVYHPGTALMDAEDGRSHEATIVEVQDLRVHLIPYRGWRGKMEERGGE